MQKCPGASGAAQVTYLPIKDPKNAHIPGKKLVLEVGIAGTFRALFGIAQGSILGGHSSGRRQEAPDLPLKPHFHL